MVQGATLALYRQYLEPAQDKDGLENLGLEKGPTFTNISVLSLSFFYMFLYGWYACVHVCVWVHVYVHTHGGPRLLSGVFPKSLSIYSLKQGLSIWLVWLAACFRVPCLCSFPVLELWLHHHAHLAFTCVNGIYILVLMFV